MVKPLSRIAMSAIPSSTAAKTAQARWQLGRKCAAVPTEFRTPRQPSRLRSRCFLRRRSLVTASARLRSPTHCSGHMPCRSLGCGRGRPSAAPLSPLLRRSRSSCQTRPQTPALADSLRGGLGATAAAGRARAVSGIKDAPPQPSLFT